ncbi:MAG: hypothetical protein R3B46_02685 [Phycisphaerales bacterium]
MRMMIAMVCASVALGASACNKKTNTNSGTSAGNSSANSGSNSSNPKPSSDSGPVKAMESFIAAMGDADFTAALAFVDPSCELHKKMGDTASNLGKSKEADDMIKAAFSAPYRKAQASLVTEEADRAIVELERAGFPPARVNLVKNDEGAWVISAGQELFAPPSGGPPPAPKPDGNGG